MFCGFAHVWVGHKFDTKEVILLELVFIIILHIEYVLIYLTLLCYVINYGLSIIYLIYLYIYFLKYICFLCLNRFISANCLLHTPCF